MWILRCQLTRVENPAHLVNKYFSAYWCNLHTLWGNYRFYELLFETASMRGRSLNWYG